MRITMTPTDKFEMADGAQCRVWTGTTGGGVECLVFVRGEAVRAEDSCDELDTALLGRDVCPADVETVNRFMFRSRDGLQTQGHEE